MFLLLYKDVLVCTISSQNILILQAVFVKSAIPISGSPFVYFLLCVCIPQEVFPIHYPLF